LAIAFLLSFTISSLGIIIATFYESFESFSAIMNFIVMPMFFLSGAMYPVNKLPEILKYISQINPLTYGIDALKHAMFQSSSMVDFSLITDLFVLSVLSVLFVTVASFIFERKK
ncbi:MAG: ABC transporter permease, partial [Nitrospiraceae bacterium]